MDARPQQDIVEQAQQEIVEGAQPEDYAVIAAAVAEFKEADEDGANFGVGTPRQQFGDRYLPRPLSYRRLVVPKKQDINYGQLVDWLYSQLLIRPHPYIDKSLALRLIAKLKKKNVLVSLPPGWSKTTYARMAILFFMANKFTARNEYREALTNFFTGEIPLAQGRAFLRIFKQYPELEVLIGKLAVLFLEFTSTPGHCYKNLVRYVGKKVQGLFQDYAHILDSPKLAEDLKNIFRSYLTKMKWDEFDIYRGIADLSLLLRYHFGVGPLIIFDGIDALLKKISLQCYGATSSAMLDFLRSFVQAAGPRNEDKWGFWCMFDHPSNEALLFPLPFNPEDPKTDDANIDYVRINYDNKKYLSDFSFSPAEVQLLCSKIGYSEVDLKPYINSYRSNDGHIYAIGSVWETLDAVQRGELRLIPGRMENCAHNLPSSTARIEDPVLYHLLFNSSIAIKAAERLLDERWIHVDGLREIQNGEIDELRKLVRRNPVPANPDGRRLELLFFCLLHKTTILLPTSSSAGICRVVNGEIRAAFEDLVRRGSIHYMTQHHPRTEDLKKALNEVMRQVRTDGEPLREAVDHFASCLRDVLVAMRATDIRDIRDLFEERTVANERMLQFVVFEALQSGFFGMNGAEVRNTNRKYADVAGVHKGYHVGFVCELKLNRESAQEALEKIEDRNYGSIVEINDPRILMGVHANTQADPFEVTYAYRVVLPFHPI